MEVKSLMAVFPCLTLSTRQAMLCSQTQVFYLNKLVSCFHSGILAPSTIYLYRT